MKSITSLLLLLSVVLVAPYSYGKKNKVDTFKGVIEIVTLHNEQERFFLFDVTSEEKFYHLVVPSHLIGVARLEKGKEVTIKGILLKNSPLHKRFEGVIKVKNIAPYIK